MISHYHRDILDRVIKDGDYVVWTNGKYGQKMQVCTVISATEHTVRIAKLNGTLTNVSPSNLLVITEQVRFNLDNNVGANL